MALINCKECGESISNQAKSCPKCGFEDGTNDLHVEATVKNLKWQRTASFWLFVISLIAFFKFAPESSVGNESWRATLTGYLWLGSLCWYFVTRLRIWWKHG